MKLGSTRLTVWHGGFDWCRRNTFSTKLHRRDLYDKLQHAISPSAPSRLHERCQAEFDRFLCSDGDLSAHLTTSPGPSMNFPWITGGSPSREGSAASTNASNSMDFASGPAPGGDIASAATAIEPGDVWRPRQRLPALKPWLPCKNYAQVPEDASRETTTILPLNRPRCLPRPAPERCETTRRLRRYPTMSRKKKSSSSKSIRSIGMTSASLFRLRAGCYYVIKWMTTQRLRRYP